VPQTVDAEARKKESEQVATTARNLIEILYQLAALYPNTERDPAAKEFFGQGQGSVAQD